MCIISLCSNCCWLIAGWRCLLYVRPARSCDWTPWTHLTSQPSFNFGGRDKFHESENLFFGMLYFETYLRTLMLNMGIEHFCFGLKMQCWLLRFLMWHHVHMAHELSATLETSPQPSGNHQLLGKRVYYLTDSLTLLAVDGWNRLQRRCCTKGLPVLALVASRFPQLAVVFHVCLQTITNY